MLGIVSLLREAPQDFSAEECDFAHLRRIEAALRALDAAIDELIMQRRETPGADVITERIAAEEAGDRLSPTELRMMISSLLFAGQDTTRQQFGLAVQTFLDHPDQCRLLAERPDLAPRAVEEIMRIAPVVTTIWRTTDDTIEFAGLTIPAGSFINVLADPAHTDPAAFGEAPSDITATRPAAQLTFGGGSHYCPARPGRTR